MNVKKEKFWTLGDITKWELSEQDAATINQSNVMKDKQAALNMMFHKETLVVNNMQKRSGYLNKMCLDELKEWMTKFSFRIRDNVRQCSEDFYEIISEVNIFFIKTHKTWSDFAANVASI